MSQMLNFPIGNFLIGAIVVIATIVALFLVRQVIKLRRVVPTNMVHIVQRQRTTVPYGKGKKDGNVYYAWPTWLPVLGVDVSQFPESVFSINLVNYEAYDSGRVPFIVTISAFFRIGDAEMAALRVANFEELQQQLQAVLQGSVRSILGNNKLEEILSDRSTLAAQFTAEVDNQLKEWGVLTVKSIEFMDIGDSMDSVVIANIMAMEQSRIQRDSRIAVAKNDQEAEEKEIEADRIVAVQKQDAEQQVGIRTAQKEKIIGIAKEESQQAIQAQAKVTAERNMEVQQVEHVKAAEIASAVAVIQAEQDRNVQVVSAEGQQRQTEIVALGDLNAAKHTAEGVRAMGEANAEAEKLILLAPVTAQITLAEAIAANPEYMNYLVSVEQIKASKEVGIKTARALGKGELKVIANAGDVHSGLGTLGDIFSAKGGGNFAAMLSSMAQTPEGQAMVAKLTGALKGG